MILYIHLLVNIFSNIFLYFLYKVHSIIIQSFLVIFVFFYSVFLFILCILYNILTDALFSFLNDTESFHFFLLFAMLYLIKKYIEVLMINYKLTLAYDGSKYNGFQKQSKHPEKTIQGKLENVLSQLFKEEIQIIGSGRTDAGVHSRGQVCNFHAKHFIELDELLLYLRTYLPQDIAIIHLGTASERFHARYHVVGKRYSYTLDNGLFPDPFTLKFAYHIPEKLNLNAMQEAADLLLGQHDFKAFTSLKSKTKSTIRTINRIDIAQEGQKIILTYEGNGFLQHMVRILTGTLIEIGQGKRAISSITDLLEGKVRSQAGFKAPAHGLCMEKVLY